MSREVFAHPARLQRLLDHATQTTAFYGSYGGAGIDAFPIVDKATYKRDYGSFQSTVFAGAQLHKRKTSGSTGTPFSVVQDPVKRRRAIAETIYFNEVAGRRPGDRMMWLYAARLAPMSRKMRVTQNIIPIDHVGMDDGDRERIVRTLRERRVLTILTISSTLWSLTRFIERRGYQPADIGVRCIIQSGERLEPHIKRRIEMAFGCPVVNRYANEENGILACGRPGEDLLYLNRATYRFEFLKPDSDEPQAAGKPARVVITDLYNLAMPMIRYDTGDLAIVADHGRSEAVALSSVEGRALDAVYDTAAGRVPAPTVSGIMAMRFIGIEQYQLVQSGARDYLLRVVPGETHHAESEFAAAMRELLGADASIAVEFVESIPRGRTGKVRAVIGEYVPEAPGSE
jgi:phenylacetate-CoA ligase